MKIKEVVAKELEKNQITQNLLIDEINELPFGSLTKVKNKNNVYVYLKYRKEDKVISKYIGRENDVLVTKLELDIRKRKTLESKLKELKEEEDLMLKMLKV